MHSNRRFYPCFWEVLVSDKQNQLHQLLSFPVAFLPDNFIFVTPTMFRHLVRPTLQPQQHLMPHFLDTYLEKMKLTVILGTLLLIFIRRLLQTCHLCFRSLSIEILRYWTLASLKTLKAIALKSMMFTGITLNQALRSLSEQLLVKL